MRKNLVFGPALKTLNKWFCSSFSQADRFESLPESDKRWHHTASGKLINLVMFAVGLTTPTYSEKTW